MSFQPPFVLLDDARPDGAATLYREPVGILAAHDPAEIAPALERLRAAAAQGLYAAGYLEYEAGEALTSIPFGLSLSQPGSANRLQDRASTGSARTGARAAPLLWFGLFERAEPLAPAALEALLPPFAGAWAGPPRPEIERAAYDDAFARVQELIAAGDIYQGNLSFRATVPFTGHPLALYARLRRAARAGWGGVIHDGGRWLLSGSPELFFRTDGAAIEARPMKGTRPRAADPAADRAAAEALAADPKERAENLMIVDLLRNDLSRIAAPGSVAVPELFAVEEYPTVHQMVSAVAARLAPGRDALDALAALFPCGSVTGAPKLRAMEVIAAVEASPRGPYCGAIGALAPSGSAAFNVAIRTLVIEEGGDDARIGLGSAVVADSTAPAEWAECIAKAAFVTAGQRPFDLIETLRFDPLDGLARLDVHVARMGASAAAFGFRFDRHALRNELHAATFRLAEAARVRVLLSPGGAVAIETGPLPRAPADPVEVALVPLPVHPDDFRLRHKTSDRAFYDEPRRAAGTFEILFVRPDGALTEGSFTSLFVPQPNGPLLTPPLGHGLLPGVLRAALLEDGRAIERRLVAADLDRGFYLGNALRGLMPAVLRKP